MAKKAKRPFRVSVQWLGDSFGVITWGRYGSQERADAEARRLLAGKWKSHVVIRAIVDRVPVEPGDKRQVLARYLRDGVTRDGWDEGFKTVREDGSVVE